MDLTAIIPIITAGISAIGAIGVAIVGVRQHQTKQEADRRKIEDDEREALRQEGALIQMEMGQANMKLAKVTAKAVLGGKPNGDVKDAMDWVQRVEDKFADYMRRACQEV